MSHLTWLSKVWKTWKSWKSQGIKPWSGKTWKTWKSQGILLKEPKMLLETMLFHSETRCGANFGNFSRQNDEVTGRCLLLMQNTLLFMHNISLAIIDGYIVVRSRNFKVRTRCSRSLKCWPCRCNYDILKTSKQMGSRYIYSCSSFPKVWYFQAKTMVFGNELQLYI